MHFGIDIRGDAEAVFEPAGLEKKPALEELEMAGKSLRPVYGGKNMPEKKRKEREENEKEEFNS